MATTFSVCVSMVTGASNPAITVSSSSDSAALIAPPQPRRSVPSNSKATYANSFGASNRAIVSMNTHFARSGSTIGQVGNNCLPFGK